nr:mitochondrial ATP synthase subunit [Ipomoea batatas]GMD57575.1 mitochondrial ATP synthase subunit [Ipomoea batatas]GMD82640.1 mitochondrial ATP synthase subunit [Ipomoea batatas]
MRQFDPWPVFFRREWGRNWPFLVGFAITGAVITKMSLGLTGVVSFDYIHQSLTVYLFCIANDVPMFH